ncbi:MAG: TIGR01440 family protein [Filifactoraceae bacterium]
MDLKKASLEAKVALEELLLGCNIEAGDLFILGCSTSEVMGNKIGKGNSLEAAELILEEIYSVLKSKGINLGVQCCEHLNRAIVVEKEVMKSMNFDEVTVKPVEHAGGSAATYAYNNLFKDAVVVEKVVAKAGMDIGQTLIGMHLANVAVPVRTSVKTIGMANLTLAKTRPKLIGGERAQYKDSIR